MSSLNLIFLVGFSFRRACVTRTTNYLINEGSWKILVGFILRSFGTRPTMSNLMKEVKQRRFITLLILKNLLELTILDEFIRNTFFNNLTDLIIFSSNLFSSFSSGLTLFLSINYITYTKNHLSLQIIIYKYSQKYNLINFW